MYTFENKNFTNCFGDLHAILRMLYRTGGIRVLPVRSGQKTAGVPSTPAAESVWSEGA